MSEYIRTTRECTFNQFHPELRLAVQSYFQEHGVVDWQAQLIRCCETVSQKRAGKLYSWLTSKPDTIIHTGLLLTSQQLIWVHHGDRSGSLLNAADLMKIGVKFHTSLFQKDVGMEIIGYVGDSNARVHGYIGMGNEPAAEQFCEDVRQAIIKLNPPSNKNIFNWPGG